MYVKASSEQCGPHRRTHRIFQQRDRNYKKKQMEMLEVKIIPEMKNSLNGLNRRLDTAEGRYCKLENRSKETTKGNTKGKNNGKK